VVCSCEISAPHRPPEDFSFRAVVLLRLAIGMASPSLVACLGPEGSFSHLITQQRFPGSAVHTLGSIGEVFDFVASQPSSCGVVPIENSSGGILIDTVDRFMDSRCTLHVQEELTLDVKLALLGHTGSRVEVIYSHPMPFFHADEWLKQNYPAAKRVSLASTAASARRAAEEAHAATLGPRQNAVAHGLDILHFPVAGDTPNITQFFVIGAERNAPRAEHQRTALAVDLPDQPGSLCGFLLPLRDAGISLKRIESRPIRGQPNTYRFYMEVAASSADADLQRALAETADQGARVRELGSYSTRMRYES
jgi:chorismate mutase / prephenate dehydratase